MEVAELLDRLESNQPETVEEIKKTFHEIFLTSKYFVTFCVKC
jgi:hypothetical protein